VRLSPTDVRALARHILSEPQFAQNDRSWWTTFSGWIQSGLEHALDDLFAGGRATVTGWVIVVAALSVAAVVAVRFGRRVQRDPAMATGTPRPSARTGRDWLSAAAMHAAAGEWRDALRCRYAALVAGLGERGVLDEVPGRTTREYASQVASRLPAVAADFAGASALFEAAWYGNDTTGPTQDDLLEQLRRRVVAQAATR
jgi:hypothetical protein